MITPEGRIFDGYGLLRAVSIGLMIANNTDRLCKVIGVIPNQ